MANAPGLCIIFRVNLCAGTFIRFKSDVDLVEKEKDLFASIIIYNDYLH